MDINCALTYCVCFLTYCVTTMMRSAIFCCFSGMLVVLISADPIRRIDKNPKSPVGTCPSKDGEYPTYLPDSNQCEVFYECSNGVAFPKECLPGLCFDPVLNVCGFPDNKSKKPKSPVGTCPSKDGEYPTYLPDSNLCEVFYECSNGQAFPKECLQGLCFDPVLNVCAFPGNKTKNVKSAVGTCPSKDGQYPTYLPDDSSCSIFYECSNGVPIAQECAPGLCFDSVLKVCGFPPESRLQSVKSAVGTCPSKDGQFPTYLPDDSSCSIFYECSNGVPIAQECAPGLCFDSVLKVCGFPPESRLQSVKSAVGTCPSKDGQFPTYLPDDSSCSIFYECSNGVAIPQECAPDLCFDPVLKVCGFPPESSTE